jgi:hypothetical protein
MRSGIVEGEPGICPDPLARSLRAIGRSSRLAAGRQPSLQRRSRPATQHRTATSNVRLIGVGRRHVAESRRYWTRQGGTTDSNYRMLPAARVPCRLGVDSGRFEQTPVRRPPVAARLRRPRHHRRYGRLRRSEVSRRVALDRARTCITGRQRSRVCGRLVFVTSPGRCRWRDRDAPVSGLLEHRAGRDGRVYGCRLR